MFTVELSKLCILFQLYFIFQEPHKFFFKCKNNRFLGLRKKGDVGVGKGVCVCEALLRSSLN